MKLKGSVTIEASVLIPVFTLIAVQLILLALNCHDNVVINCAADKVCMRYEFEMPIVKENSKKSLEGLSGEVSRYIASKTMTKKPNIQIKSGFFKTETDYSQIVKNNPVDFVWQTEAIKNLIPSGGDDSYASK